MRVTCAVASRKRRKRVLERAKGFYGASSKQIRTVYDAVDKAGVHSYKGRKQKKQPLDRSSLQDFCIPVFRHPPVPSGMQLEG